MLSGQGMVVVGPNRSGTSAIGSALQTLGVYFGEDKDIPKGGIRLDYDTNENSRLVAISGRVLAEIELGGTPTRDLPLGWQDFAKASDMVGETAGFLSDYFGGHELWGWKDPHATLIIPFLEEAFGRLETRPLYLLSARDPYEMAQGLMKRQGYSLADVYGFWTHYVLTALTATPADRLFVIPYAKFVMEPRKFLEPIWTSCSLTSPSEDQWAKLADTVRPELRRSEPSTEELPAIVRKVWELVSSMQGMQLTPDELAHANELHQEWQEWRALTRMPSSMATLARWRIGEEQGTIVFDGERKWREVEIALKPGAKGTIDFLFSPLYGYLYLRNIRFDGSKTVDVLPRPMIGAFLDIDSHGMARIAPFGPGGHCSFILPGSHLVKTLKFELQLDVSRSASHQIAGRLGKDFIQSRSGSSWRTAPTT